jgi:GNAT superfamily N-acetyltransferase
VHLTARTATEDDAAAIALLRTRVADELTRLHGRGAWSWGASERGVVRDIKTSRVLIASDCNRILGTLRLQTTKPWAIDRSYFFAVERPLYLIDMAVEPDFQRRGIGRFLIEQAKTTATAWPSDAIRLDAFDSAAGAGPFYKKCGYREVGRVVYRGTPLVYFELLLI